MRHKNSGRKLGRNSSHRKALFNNLAIAMVKYELIQTTDAKAKELRSVADHLITLGKRDTLHARRQAFAVLKDRDLVGKLFNDLAKREELTSRSGGYTRVLKVGNRGNDNAPMSRVSWVGSTVENTMSLRYPAHLLSTTDASDEVEG
jgi:large subunit ribosomal protein L17